MAIQPFYDLELLFKQIDYKESFYIDQFNLKSFLLKCSYIPNDNLILGVIRRADIDCDLKLNIKEFRDAIRP